MFKKLFGIADKPPRQLSQVSDLQVGDIISLKHRNELPDELQGQDLEVTEVNTYQYETDCSSEFTLKTSTNAVYYLCMDNEDGQHSLGFSKKIKRGDVISLFDEDAFSMLWDEGEFAQFDVKPQAELSSWLADSYSQQIKFAQSFYHARDCRGEQLSNDRIDDNAEEIQYHECEGSDDRFALTVEVSSNGQTDVFLEVYTLTDVVEQFFPHDN